MLSKEFDELAKSIDEFLSNRQTPRHNPTQVQLIGNSRWAENEGVRTNPQFAVNLRLPAVEKKWQLRFSSYDDQDQFEGLSRNRSGAQPQNRKTGASVGLIRKVNDIDFLFRPRLEFRDPLVSSFLMRGDQQIIIQKHLQLQWTQKVFAHSVDGVGSSFELDFNIRLGPLFYLRLFNESQYLDKENFFEVSQGPTLAWNFGKKYGLTHTLSLNSQSRDRDVQDRRWNSYHLNSYTFYTSFSHRILNNVLHYQITPELRFAKAYHFKGKAGVNFQISLIF